MPDNLTCGAPLSASPPQYDEVFPQNMETKHGGFYINSGELNYRELSSDEDTKVGIVTPRK